jgi:hypothetical protein
MTIRSRIVVCGLAFAISVQFVVADNYNVINTNDSGTGSLRQAILDANAHTNVGGPDTISFAIPGGGVQTITPGSALPAITDPVTVDGYTQPGASANTLAVGDNAVLLIELNGTSVSGSGLILGGPDGGSTIRGLVINRFVGDFYDSGIFLDSGNNVVAGNFIGTDPTGNSELGNYSGARVATGVNNLIGGSVPAARNIISGNNAQEGNLIIEPRFGSAEPTPSGTLIRGNYIGTNAAGTAAVHPQAGARPGVVVIVGAGTVIGGTDVGARNVISGNSDGIQTTETSLTLPVQLTVQGNFIGVDVTGLTALPNAGYGIFFTPPRDRSDSSLTLGGTAAGAGNVISGNTANGLLLSNSNLVMQGNRIGTDLAGNLNLGNGNHGVELTRGGSPPFPLVQFTVGGTTSAARNIISGNGGFGLRFFNPTSSTTVQGNFIGTKADGQTALGNGSNGIEAQTTATIGGTVAGAGNVLAFNYTGAGGSTPRGGILVSPEEGGDETTGVSILGNSLFSNGGLGISFGSESPAANDDCDADTGPNNLQNYPVLTAVTSGGGMTSIVGTLNSVANTTYRIEFFANDAIDPSGYGEGQSFVGFTNVTIGANCNASFNMSVPQIGGAQRVTATATDPSGNTSEFSAANPILNPTPTPTPTATPGQLLNISTRLRVQTGDNVLIGGFIITGTAPKRVIVRGIGPSLAQFFPDFLADPTLELHDGSGTTLATNDNWKTKPDGSSQQAEIEATGIPPTNDLESALVTTLPANNGAYTAILRGKNDTIGIGVVEAYDLDTAVNSKLANISTRGLVETGNDVLIAGFITGNGVTRVIIRAIGPTLGNAGVPNPLLDPTLELFNGSGTSMAMNDDWRMTQEAEIEATGIPPTDNRESAIVASLPPGAYTAVVRGKNDTTGIAVVEVYNIP